MFYKLLISLLVFACYCWAQDIEANWAPCTYENGTEIPTKSSDISVFVSNCSRNESECRFKRGTSAQLNITFRALADSPEIERGILAKMYMSALGKYVRIPYGNPINPCHSMKSLNETTRLSDMDISNNTIPSSSNCQSSNTDDNCVTTNSTATVPHNCLSTGIQTNHIYNSISEFDVSNDFPEVRGIQVMVLFRHKVANSRVSNLRKWDKHPGPLFLCIVLDNCAVV